MEEQKRLFVYNAGSDLFSSATDMAHKIFSPETGSTKNSYDKIIMI